MAYNHGREDRKWRIWKEAEEKLLRECGGGFSLRRPKFSLLMRRTDVVFFPCRKKIAP